MRHASSRWLALNAHSRTTAETPHRYEATRADQARRASRGRVPSPIALASDERFFA